MKKPSMAPLPVNFTVAEIPLFAACLPLVMPRLVFHLNGRAWQKNSPALRDKHTGLSRRNFGKTLDKRRFRGNRTLL